MNKIIITLMLLFTMGSAQAQEVYHEILRLSKAAANDKRNDMESRKVNTFKVDALNYMVMKAREQMPDSTLTMLNYQAYALYDYVNLYVKKLGEAKSKRAKEHVLQLFRQASVDNPRYYDNDKKVSDAYLFNENFITNFSLDTNWIAAIEQVRKQLRKEGL